MISRCIYSPPYQSDRDRTVGISTFPWFGIDISSRYAPRQRRLIEEENLTVQVL